MHFDLYRDARREWRWRLVAGNGRKIANSGEGYLRKADALAAIDLVNAMREAPVMVARDPVEDEPEAEETPPEPEAIDQEPESPARRYAAGMFTVPKGMIPPDAEDAN